jgi:hypothetical protein
MKKRLIVILAFFFVQYSFAAAEISEIHLGESTTLKPTALLQVWGIGNQLDSSKNENIRIRRAEIKVTGNIATDSLRYFVMVDPSRLIVPAGAKSMPTIAMIQDIGFGFKIIPQLELIVGQYKTPTTAEGLDSSSQLPLPERSYVGRTLGDKREVGAGLVYKETYWTTALMLSNGATFGRTSGAFHDVDARVDLRPTAQLGVGAFATLGNDFNYASKGRYGLNARYKLGKAKFRTEFAHAMDFGKTSDGMDNEIEWDFTENMETVVRYEFYIPNFGSKALSQAETIGMNYYLRNWNSKLQLSASVMQNMSSPNGTPTLSDGFNNAEVMVALQASI